MLLLSPRHIFGRMLGKSDHPSGAFMRQARSKLPLATGVTQLALCLSAALVVDHGANAGTVTACNDSGAAGTLRSVVAAAASDENIDVTNCSSITLTSGQITSSLTKLRIVGSVTAPTTIFGNNASRVITHTGTGGSLLLRGLTIANGYVTGPTALGGCVYSAANVVSLDSVRIENCTAKETSASGLAKGGGVFAAHLIDLRNSVITGNTARQQSSTDFKARGGGIYAESLTAFNSRVQSNEADSVGGGKTSEYTEGGGIVTIGGARLYNSTIYDNHAGKYGGMKLDKDGVNSVVIANSTITGNVAMHSHGGFGVGAAPFVLANSTVVFNQSYFANGAAGIVARGSVKLLSSIIARNTFVNGTGSDLLLEGMGASIDPASANNLIMVSAAVLPADTIRADPRLEALADNGGRTRTHALKHDSPALDRGNALFEYGNFTPLTCDQRGHPGVAQSNPPNTDNCNDTTFGYLRVDSDPLHMHADIGAYEEQLPNPDWIFYDGHEGDYL
jgi:hypothetical protein